jgi:hypothetical protein
VKPLGKVKIKWSPEFAYAIGLLTTDGNLSLDGRHFTFVSKDKEQIDNFLCCLGVKVKIGRSFSGYDGSSACRVQIGDRAFYDFLLSIGLMPNKSKILNSLLIPDKYFFDFLRGHFDGDGSFHSYWDPRWHSSYMFYTIFASASKSHITWLRKTISAYLPIQGHITKAKRSVVYQLKYAKGESLQLLSKMYYDGSVVCLSRKRLKIEKALKVEGKHL